MTGVLGAIPTAGVGYTTPTQTGTTNSAGQFSYRSGETVQFAVGDLDLGTAAGASLITMFDLVGVSTPPTIWTLSIRS